ncbi:MFS transporter [Brevibacterium daeguense]|uniref:MFS transporter n=1 Tax=Brevibacterium daeguense TaxID=909936 RepID=A0ABP8ELU8_9MICO|nr:MFS transporter [Brevibacterium daeguense]
MSSDLPDSGGAGARGWFLALIGFTVVVQAAFNGIRVLISYRTLELGGGAAVLGLVAATFSLMPLLAAIPIGRWVDRGYAAPVMWVGTGLTIMPAALAAAAENIPVLLLANMALGMGQILTTVSGQALIPQSFPTAELNRRFGSLTIGVSCGQALGVPLAGFVAGAGEEPQVQVALWVMAAISVLAVPLMLGVATRPAPRHISRSEAKSTSQSPPALLGIKGMKPAIFASMATLAAVDIMTAYLPLVGQSYGLGVQLVTLLLTVRTLASIVSRLFIGQLTRRFEFRALLGLASLAGGVALVLIPVLPRFWFLAILMLIAGFAFGLTQPMTMTWVSMLADPANRAAVLSIRLAGNRLSQVVIPALASAVAVVAPAGSVFLMSGALLGMASLTTLTSGRPPIGRSKRKRLE